MAIVRLYGGYAEIDGREYGMAVRLPLDADEVDRHAARVCIRYDMRRQGINPDALSWHELMRYAAPGDLDLPEVTQER